MNKLEKAKKHIKKMKKDMDNDAGIAWSHDKKKKPKRKFKVKKMLGMMAEDGTDGD
jgi:hypothetical protein